MATPINTTDVAVSELQTAPGGSTTSNMSFSDMAQPGWNQGTKGSNTYPYYCWGLGYGTAGGGTDCIYGLTPLSGSVPPFGIGLFRGLVYWFDGSTYDIKYQYSNAKANPPGPPSPIPPTANDVQITVDSYDSSNTYMVFPTFSINAPANTSGGPFPIPGFVADSYPLVRDVYWAITVQTDPVFWPGGSIQVQVNGITVFSGGLGAGTTNITWQSGGASSGSTNASGITFNFVIT
jgi:hypothetical protein